MRIIDTNYGIIDEWNSMPKENAEAENLNTFKNRLLCHLANFFPEGNKFFYFVMCYIHL